MNTQNKISLIERSLKSTFIIELLEGIDELFLVGGSVRDFLLGRNIVDFDFVVHPYAIENIEKFLGNKKIKYFFLSSGKFKLLRVIQKGIKFDFMGMLLPIEEDMARRDFTINTIYYNVKKHSVFSDSRAFDDINNKVLRVVKDSSIADDPVRSFRAVRFASCLDLSIEEATKQFVKDGFGMSNSIKKERIREELKKSFQCDFGKIASNLSVIFKIDVNDIERRGSLIDEFGLLGREVNKEISYGTLAKVALIAIKIPDFDIGFNGREKKIIDEVKSIDAPEDFGSLFKLFLRYDARVLLANAIAKLPISKALRIASIIDKWVKVKLSGNDIKNLAYEVGSLKEARIEILKEKCRQIYDEV